LCTRTSWS